MKFTELKHAINESIHKIYDHFAKNEFEQLESYIEQYSNLLTKLIDLYKNQKDKNSILKYFIELQTHQERIVAIVANERNELKHVISNAQKLKQYRN